MKPQHVIALIAAILSGAASVFQAWRALEKAEYERNQLVKQGAEDSSTSNFNFLSEFRKNAPNESGFNVRHFRHVAILWGVIVVGSALAAIAEFIDLLTDRA